MINGNALSRRATPARLDGTCELAWAASVQAGDDVLAVLLVLVTVRLVHRVRDRGHQFAGALAELPSQDREGGLAGVAVVRDVLRA